jgi:hypothetical protein
MRAGEEEVGIEMERVETYAGRMNARNSWCNFCSATAAANKAAYRSVLHQQSGEGIRGHLDFAD